MASSLLRDRVASDGSHGNPPLPVGVTSATPPMGRRLLSVVEGAILGVALWASLLALNILPAIVADTPGLVALALGGGIAGLGSRPRWLLVLLGPVTAVILLVSSTSVSHTIIDSWVRQDRFARDTVSAILVLSGGLNPDTTISPDALDRLVTGLELVRAQRSHVLVTTVTDETFPTGHVISVTDQARIVRLVGSGVDWVRVPGGESTRDEAVAAAKLLLPKGLTEVAIVASPMHSRRACAVFEAVGFIVTCVPARMRDLVGRPLSPGPRERLAAFGQWVYELAAMRKYHLCGWLPGDRIRNKC